jgi:hypothetical protein
MPQQVKMELSIVLNVDKLQSPKGHNMLDKTNAKYIVNHYRNIPEQTEEIIRDFIEWVNYDAPIGMTQTIDEHVIAELESLIDTYLLKDKITAAENELLADWINANADAK